jgi:hypothetical protein
MRRSSAPRRCAAPMLADLDYPADPSNAYPVYWAPFVVVGEGQQIQTSLGTFSDLSSLTGTLIGKELGDGNQ